MSMTINQTERYTGIWQSVSLGIRKPLAYDCLHMLDTIYVQTIAHNTKTMRSLKIIDK